MIKKILLLLEVIGVFLTGALFSIFFTRMIGISDWLTEANELILLEYVPFFELSLRSTTGMLIKYSIIFTLVITFLKLIREDFKHENWGIKMGKGNIISHLDKAILLFCVGGLIPKLLMACWPYGWVGEGPAHWNFLHQEWSMGFWLFLLGSSIILPPIVEELYFRGYAQGRLEKHISPAASIIFIALVFTIFHTQYFQLSIISIGMVFSLLLSATILGYARYYTGSIIPGIIAHALGNIAIIGWPAFILGLIMILYIIYNRKKITRHALNFVMMVKDK